MAKIPEGILGKFIGKAGPVSGHMWNGQNILRTGSRSGSTRATPARIAQQQKIKLCNNFTKAFTGTGFFNKSFPAYGDGGTGYNRATSVLMSKAIIGTYPGTYLSYPNIFISQGPLPGAENALAVLQPDGNILFSWVNNCTTGIAQPDDKVILVAYFPGERNMIYSLNAGIRSQCEALLVKNDQKVYPAETWIGFISDDEKNAANSVYTGQVIF